MRKLSLMVMLLCLAIFAQAQEASVDNYGTLKVAPQSVDYSGLLHNLQATNSQNAYERFKNEFVEISDQLPDYKSDPVLDDMYTKRLKMMATEIQLPYNNIVRRYIDLYTRTGGPMEWILGAARYYFPIFEQALYRHGLPMELKILPVIESALIPDAKSRAAAVGLWQMMILTGKYYGLEVTSFVDDRCDPVKSSDAACRYLKDLYRTYGDWTLVLAAYNCGPGNVNKAIKRAGLVRNYWDIWEYLPRETRSYVPAFIGATYGYTFQKAHNMNIKSPSFPMAVDTVMVNKMMHLEQVSSTIGVSMDVLRTLNPQYRIDIIPAIDEKCALILPTASVGKFIDSEAQIYAKDSVYLKKYLEVKNFSSQSVEVVANNAAPAGSGKTTYKVKSGDILGKIADRYNVRVSDLQKWNKIKGTMIRPGQKLTIYRK
ncbi:MAG: transglycosylase SLT domain-containing protein [Mucinivorans sp.]